MTQQPLPEMMLVEIPTEAKSLLDGDRLSYMAAGDPLAPVVLLLHGSGASAAVWRHQFAALSRDFRVVAWNVPGYGLSDPLAEPQPRYSDYAKVLAAFCDALGITTAHVVGNSFGAGLALVFAHLYPERVMSLALSGASAGARGRGQTSQGQDSARRAAYFEGGRGAFEYSRAVLDLVCSASASPEVRQEILNVLATTGERGYRQLRHATAAADPLQFAASLTMPTLFYHGTADQICPLHVGAMALSETMPQAQLVMLEGVGHLPDLEASEVVNHLLVSFLQKGLPVAAHIGISD